MRGGPKALVRGMYVKVIIHAESDTQLLRLPERLIQPGNVVWCVRDGKLVVVQLRNVNLFGDHVIVPASEQGLKAGDRVISTPLNVATDGMPVEVKEAKAELVREAAL